MSNSQLSPIVLFVYNRLEETKRTIASLQQNKLASQSILYIYSDAPKNEKNIKEVNTVREYINKISGFKEIIITQRKNNFGLAKNIIEGVTSILNQHNKIIVLEDDLITSRNFLCYMNQALDFYENSENIFSISGYTMPLKSLSNHLYDTYLAYRPSSWGWATWKDRWENIDWKIKDFNDFLLNRKSIRLFNRGGNDMTRMLKNYFKGKNNSWAIRWSYAMYKSNKYSVYPRISKIQNIGFGENATHCSGINIYQTKLDLSEACSFNFSTALHPDPILAKEFKYQYSYTNKLIRKCSILINDKLLKL